MKIITIDKNGLILIPLHQYDGVCPFTNFEVTLQDEISFQFITQIKQIITYCRTQSQRHVHILYNNRKRFKKAVKYYTQFFDEFYQLKDGKL